MRHCTRPGDVCRPGRCERTFPVRRTRAMRPALRPWLWFGLCLALGLGAMGWVTWITLRAARAEEASLARGAQEETVRRVLKKTNSSRGRRSAG